MDTKLMHIVRIDNYDDETGKRQNGETLAVFTYGQDAKDFVKSRIERQVLSTYHFAGQTVEFADIERGEIVVSYSTWRTRTVYTVTQDLR